ncbi:hypothetical protein ACP70R_008289 [Stipagrostis hirtigluma subsp. patula]
MAGAIELLYFLFLCICSLDMVSPGSNNSTDELVLLSFKSVLSSEPSSLLASWNSSSHFCSWPGVVCGRRHPDRVVALRMGSFNISGRISPFLGNLSFLIVLDLHDNQLVGRIPPELGRLRRLQMLNLTKNHLQGSIPVTLGGCTKLKKLHLRDNQLQGEIPYEIGSLKNLVSLHLGTNALSGEIPPSLAGLQSIKFLTLYENRLSGEIPPALGNLTDLHLLELSNNILSGTIPSSLGMLSSLSWLNLGMNNLTGLIPTSLWNISSLMGFSVHKNMLTGTIPPNAFHNVPHLQQLVMNENQFHGPIPASISNASDIAIIQLHINSFGGFVPTELGNLKYLKWLQLVENFLHSEESVGWEFLRALTNCSQLKFLGLSENNFSGVLPDSLSNLSISLTDLYLEDNKISGSIPKDIGNLISLESLILYKNFLTGSLPSSLCRLTNLVVFYAYGNSISGSLLLHLGNLTRLATLYLDMNEISGKIPSTIGSLTMLSDLGLSHNYLTGPIPNTIFNIPTLTGHLDLSYNNLEGPLPQEIGNLNNLAEFHAESNNLSGEIPATIGQCQLLRNLFLQNNTLSGSIPLLLSQMKGLEFVDLSSNNLSGQIPKSLGNLTMLHHLNVSFNSLDGEVPNFGVFANVTAISVQGNAKLCGGVPGLHLPTCPVQLTKRKHKFLVVPIVISLVTTLVVLPLLCMLLFWHMKRETEISSTDSTQTSQSHPMISYSQLVRATDGFSATNLLGSGSFGSVYKGKLHSQEGQSTNVVAVKVLKLQTPKALKSFTAECEALRHMRHRNLVKIFTICSSIDTSGKDFKAIVYDFMPNGSLESWLHPDTNSQTDQRYLNLSERVTILLDVANALDYLHCHGPTPVVHCDLKSSNVLLDADMVAHVGDFGLAKILVQRSSLLQHSTSSMGLRGSIGYAAPEYGAGNMVSTHGDIYSYGILVLETITGKRPTDSRIEQGLSLREYVDLALHNRVMDAVDTRLSLDLENNLHMMRDSVVSLLRLGMSCTQELPSNRMPTGDIIKELLAIKDYLLVADKT